MSLRTLLADVEHGLEHQSYAPRELLSGVVCADGYGVAWQDDDAAIARYAYPGPIWSDGNLQSMMASIRSTSIVAAVRNATVAGDNTAANCAPFVRSGWSWSLNGFLGNLPIWREFFAGGDPAGNTDGEWLFMTFLDRLEGADNPGQAMQELCRDALEFARQHDVDAQLNILASNGDVTVATRAGTTQNNSLYALVDGDDFPDAIVIASEPVVDDARWKPVEENTVVVAQTGAPLVHLRI